MITLIIFFFFTLGRIISEIKRKDEFMFKLCNELLFQIQFSKTSEKLINWTSDGGKSSLEATTPLFSLA